MTSPVFLSLPLPWMPLQPPSPWVALVAQQMGLATAAPPTRAPLATGACPTTILVRVRPSGPSYRVTWGTGRMMKYSRMYCGNAERFAMGL